jgi:hypothetical protein
MLEKKPLRRSNVISFPSPPPDPLRPDPLPDIGIEDGTAVLPVNEDRIPAPNYRCLDCRRPNTVIHGSAQDRARLKGAILTIYAGNAPGAG